MNLLGYAVLADENIDPDVVSGLRHRGIDAGLMSPLCWNRDFRARLILRFCVMQR